MAALVRVVATFGGFAILLAAGPAGAQSKCLANKLRAVAKKEAAKLNCHAKVVLKGDPGPLDSCLERAETRFQRMFAAAESSGSCSGTVDACECHVDACVAIVRGALPDAGPDTCESARLKAAGKKAKRLLQCNAAAARRGEPVDGDCIVRAKQKFESDFAATTGCTGDEATAEDLIDRRCVIRLGADANGTLTVGNICGASCGAVPAPPCAVAGTPCGSCGDGICVSHCPGGDLVCLSNGSFNTPGCSADAQCPALGEVCAANGVAACGTGVLNSCAAACP